MRRLCRRIPQRGFTGKPPLDRRAQAQRGEVHEVGWGGLAAARAGLTRPSRTTPTVSQTAEWACGTVDPMSLVGQIAELQNLKTYKELSWEGSFEDYLELVR